MTKSRIMNIWINLQLDQIDIFKNKLGGYAWLCISLLLANKAEVDSIYFTRRQLSCLNTDFAVSYRAVFSVLNDAKSKHITSAENTSIVWQTDQ